MLPALTLFGNILVCLSVYIERTLHTVTNYFIVSLAVADIMVAVLVMPPAVYVEVHTDHTASRSHTQHWHMHVTASTVSKGDRQGVEAVSLVNI